MTSTKGKEKIIRKNKKNKKKKGESREWIRKKKRKGRWTDTGKREEEANWLSQALLGQCAELPDQK